MNGWELYDRIRDDPSWENIHIVILSTSTDRIDENARQFLGDGFIKKPVKMDKLINLVEKNNLQEQKGR